MYYCEVCWKDIINDAHGGAHPSAGDHDPAYHSAKAYHYKTVTELEYWICASDRFQWPCITYEGANEGTL